MLKEKDKIFELNGDWMKSFEVISEMEIMHVMVGVWCMLLSFNVGCAGLMLGF